LLYYPKLNPYAKFYFGSSRTLINIGAFYDRSEL
jgi:hypothetical protein